jgi:hypothetical protein
MHPHPTHWREIAGQRYYANPRFRHALRILAAGPQPWTGIFPHLNPLTADEVLRGLIRQGLVVAGPGRNQTRLYSLTAQGRAVAAALAAEA